MAAPQETWGSGPDDLPPLPPGAHGVGEGTALANHLIDQAGNVIEGVKSSDIEERLSDGQFFWLDLPGLGDEQVGWLRDLFKFHPLAVEDATQFGERPKMEEYDDYVFLVFYGSGTTADGDVPPDQLRELSEVHFFVSEHYMVTVHRGTCPSLHEMAMRFKGRKVAVASPAHLFHRVADTLVDSFFPVLSDIDDRIDALQDRVIEKPSNDQLRELLDYRSALISLRKVIAPQRDMFASLASGAATLPGFDQEAERYYRDVYDHLIRLSDLIDAYRDLLSGTTDAYLSVVSNQLNVVMKQLTIISTVFLPLAFLTGFFGQNFGWLVNNLGSWEVFVGLGLGSEVVAVLALMALFRSRGWLGSKD